MTVGYECVSINNLSCKKTSYTYSAQLRRTQMPPRNTLCEPGGEVLHAVDASVMFAAMRLVPFEAQPGGLVTFHLYRIGRTGGVSNTHKSQSTVH